MAFFLYVDIQNRIMLPKCSSALSCDLLIIAFFIYVIVQRSKSVKLKILKPPMRNIQ